MRVKCAVLIAVAISSSAVLCLLFLSNHNAKQVAKKSKDELIIYHRTEMKRARKSMFGERVEDNGLTGHQIIEKSEHRYEFHRNKLVELGYFFQKNFHFDKVSVKHHGALWRKISNEFADIDHIALAYPTNILSVWDCVDRRRDWVEFHRLYNNSKFGH